MCTYLHEQSKAMRSVGGPRGCKRASSRATRSKTSMGMLRRGEVDDCMDGGGGREKASGEGVERE